MLTKDYRRKYQQLVKISKENGTLEKTKRMYLMNLLREYKNEKAAAATATRDQQFLN
ncbi:hypothetical protein D3C73_470720 [compost metagenome]